MTMDDKTGPEIIVAGAISMGALLTKMILQSWVMGSDTTKLRAFIDDLYGVADSIDRDKARSKREAH